MSDYYSSDTLEDWLAEEVFAVDKKQITPNIVILFERWRDDVESSIRGWWDTSDEDGYPMSWRGYGRGYGNIADDEMPIVSRLIKHGIEQISIK